MNGNKEFGLNIGIMAALIFVTIIIALFCSSCDKDDFGTNTGCLRDTEPSPPYPEPNDTIWFQESHEGLWVVIYKYNYLEGYYQEFVYGSENSCKEWTLINHIKIEADFETEMRGSVWDIGEDELLFDRLPLEIVRGIFLTDNNNNNNNNEIWV